MEGFFIGSNMVRPQMERDVASYLGIHWMVVGLLCFLSLQVSAEQDASKAVSLNKLIPSLESLGEMWTQTKLTYYVDPLSKPPYYILPDQPDHEAFKAFLDRRVLSLGCESLLRIHYGKGELAINSGGHHLMIHRWDQFNRLEEEWDGILKKAPFNQDELPEFGEAACWAHHDLFQSLAFRRGNYLVRIECGRSETVYGLLDLAEAIDELIKKTTAK